MIAALYVSQRGPYLAMDGVDPWTVERDARQWWGQGKCIAHPPCAPWSKLKAFARNDDPALAVRAVDQVRQFGGVLEHPEGSGLFAHCGLPLPEGLPDYYGGRVYLVDQSDYGHAARKRTWLYAVGLGPCPFRLPSGRPATSTVEAMSSRVRHLTPRAFAHNLVEWVRAA